MNGASRFVKRGRGVAASAALALAIAAIAPKTWASPLPPLLAGAEGFADRGFGGIRGITLGPIENSRHADKGYGTDASARSMVEARTLGANWVSLTPFGRTWDLAPTGIDLTFETPFEENRKNVLRAIHQAHAEGLKVFLVPHLWVETGGWRTVA